MKIVCIYGLKLQILISQIPNVLQGMELKNRVVERPTPTD